VARIAELFGEEDLTRHLQIMLRTHGELGFKQEQRFHLELGLLKMAQAQKLLPLEQLLSDVAPVATGQKSAARPSIVSGSAEPRRQEQGSAARSNYVSPFAADSARKGTPRQEDPPQSAPATGPRIVAKASQPEPVILGATAALAELEDSPRDIANPSASVVPVIEVEKQEEEADGEALPSPVVSAESTGQIEKLQTAVLEALTGANQRILVSMLSAGDWSIAGNEVIIKIAESQTIVDMSLGTEGKRIAVAAASGVLGRAVKVKVIPGATVAPEEKKNGGPRLGPGPGGRNRAEQDPIIRRMQEKFGAEIRTVIDYREKR